MDSFMEHINTVKNGYPMTIERSDNPVVYWKKPTREKFTQPFFHDEFIHNSKKHLINTPLNTLTSITSKNSLPLSALIFHVSRCGSTLMTQQLMQSDSCLVISEPSIIESALRFSRNAYSEAEKIALLRSVVYALGRPQNNKQTHFIIKLDCWHIADLPLFEKAFPDTPLFCLYRNPHDVFQSHQKQIGQQMVPGLIDASGLSLDLSNIAPHQLDLYSLEVLKRIYTLAVKYAQQQKVKLINYTELPQITASSFAHNIALNLTNQECKQVLMASKRHSKYQTPFTKEKDSKESVLIALTPYKEHLAIINKSYDELEQINQQQDWKISIEKSNFETHNMTDAFHKLPLVFDQQQLTKDLTKILNRPWLNHVNTSVHNGEWNVLPLRSVDGLIDNGAVVEMDPERYKSTPYLDQCDYFKEVLASLKCTIVSARLLRLKAGGKIGRHNDHDLCFEDGCARLHIPIQTHPAVTFHINDEPIHFAQGECWYMNANYYHQVANDSTIDRIHLVVDCMVNDWLKSLFYDSGYETQIVEHKYGDAGITDDNVLDIIAQLNGLQSPASKDIANRLQTIWNQNKTES